MTLSILEKSKKNSKKNIKHAGDTDVCDIKGTNCKKTAIVYACITVFCAVFGRVYTMFGHGVTSLFMTYVFLPPLVGGVVVYLLFMFLKTDMLKYRFSVNLYNSAIATVTVAFALNGVLGIADTTSDYMIVFWIVSAVLLVAAVAGFIVAIANKKDKVETSETV